MSEKVSVIWNGDDSINFKCPGVFKVNVKKGDVIENVPHETYLAEMKQDHRYILVSEKPAIKGKAINKLEKVTESEGK